MTRGSVSLECQCSQYPQTFLEEQPIDVQYTCGPATGNDGLSQNAHIST